MIVAQQLMKAQEDRHHRTSETAVGDEILVNTFACWYMIFVANLCIISSLTGNVKAK